ncbi:MAG TPA: hypothetical protein VI584_03815 [Nitrospiria bacterium]|nr:hypothetical protein [Nitrospiria bacterium]
MGRSASIIIGILIFFVGCTATSPYLEPSREEKVPEGKEYITVYARPIYTKGWFSEDKKRFGIDLSSYFAAFDIKIINKTNRTLNFDKNRAGLVDNTGATYAPLGEDEGVEYYKSGGLGSDKAIVVLPKSRKIAEEDIERIRKIILSDRVNIGKGEEKSGIILFKKLKGESCKGITLKIKGITVEGSEQEKEFEFRFVCPDK